MLHNSATGGMVFSLGVVLFHFLKIILGERFSYYTYQYVMKEQIHLVSKIKENKPDCEPTAWLRKGTSVYKL